MNSKIPDKLQSKRKYQGEKVALGMSGGVDSSLSAHLLKEQGYDVTGVYLECWKAPGCRSEQDRQDASEVASSLDIPFKVLNFKQAYKEKVVEYFFQEYKKGLTPNPDIMCNKEIKFGLFYNWAMQNNFNFVATGHYAKITSVTNVQQLAIPKDKHKDQTYFLYPITQNQVEHALFPLANLTKDEVRTEAKKRKIKVADKKDSVGICFIGDIDVHQFLKDRLGENVGEVVNTNNEVIGSHNGLWFYTIGQRHGFTINKKTVVKLANGQTITKENIPPFYVIKKLAKTNQLVVGFGSETLNDKFSVTNLHWIVKDNEKLLLNNQDIFIRIRHTGKLIACRVKQVTKKEITINLKEKVHGVAQGQSAVFYKHLTTINETICLGGGIIL